MSDLRTNWPVQVTDYLNPKLYNQAIVEVANVTGLPQHKFSWNSTKRKIMMLALFRQVMQVADTQLANPEDIVWLWTPPTGTTDPGEALFSNGKLATYKNGKFILSDMPKTDPLKPAAYVWAVWAWDDKALNIVAASRELPINILTK